MGRKSKIENHTDRKIIEKRLASGEEYSDIIRDFPGLKWDDLDYYKRNKLNTVLSKSSELKNELEQEHGDDTLAEVKGLQTRAMEILTQAQEAGDLKTALLGIREARGCLELVFKAEGRIHERPQINLTQVNIYDSPQWIAVGNMLADVLSAYPELKTEVAKRLLALSRGEV